MWQFGSQLGSVLLPATYNVLHLVESLKVYQRFVQPIHNLLWLSVVGRHTYFPNVENIVKHIGKGGLTHLGE